jgi:hypothetical protein
MLFAASLFNIWLNIMAGCKRPIYTVYTKFSDFTFITQFTPRLELL